MQKSLRGRSEEEPPTGTNRRFQTLRRGGFKNPVLFLLLPLFLAAFLSVVSSMPVSAQIPPRPDAAAGARMGSHEAWPAREVVFLDRLFRPRGDGFTQRSAGVNPPAQSDVHPYESILNGLRPGISPRAVVALQFAEHGRRLLQAGAYQRSLAYFERALGLGAGPYIYYYLAQAHYRLAHSKESLQFLDVAQSLLAGESDWMLQLETLRAKFSHQARETRSNIKPIIWPAR